MRTRGLVVVALSTAIGFAVGGLFLASCKKTVEGENKAWERNLAHVQELTVLYPGFANALGEQKKRAEAAMSAARSISDKEAAAKKMAEANGLLDVGFVSTLGQLDSREKTLRDKLVTASTEAEHGADQAGARAVTDDAQRILRNIDDQIKQGAADPISADVLLRKIDSDLSSASANVDRVIAAAQKRKQEATKAAAAAAAPTGAAGAPSAPVAKVQWKCSYCQHMNDDARQKCENCGAPRPNPSAPKPGPAKKK
jgi:hypothetical protein